MKKLTTTMKKNLRIFLIAIGLAAFSTTLFAKPGPSPKETKDWTIVETYNIPGKASGLAWDGTYIYFGIYGSNGDQVYRFDPSTGNSELLFTNATINDSYGMTFDGTNLWITDHGLSSSVPAYALELDFSGNVQSQFDLPDHYMSGIAYDNGDFWVATYYPDPGTIYKVDATGSIISQFTSPGAQPWDVCVEGDNLWIAEYNDYLLYKVDQSGNILETHPCENQRPAGIVYDGQFLWYVDGPLSSNSTLYKVDLGGAGTPAIEIPVNSYNFGNVAIGDSAVWNCVINNYGTAPLEINNLVYPGSAPIFVYENLPITIDPGNNTTIQFIYKPTESGSLNTIITVESNDPVNPEEELTVEGEAVYAGAHINVPVTSHAYGSTRLNATTRWFLEITNDGSQTLEISDIAFDDDHFYLDNAISFPISIGVLATAQIGIWFQPESATSYSATAEISHNDPTQDPIEISLTGNGNDDEYPIGENFWHYTINTSYDNSIKGITAIDDVTGDNVSDVIVCSEDNYIRCFNGNSDGMADMIWENEAGSVYRQSGITVIEDINNDGYMDVVAGLTGGVRAIKALSGLTGELLWIFDTHIYGDGGWVYQVWVKYDYNGDGFPDVLASTGNDGTNTGPKRFFCLDGTDGTLIWDNYIDGPGFSVIGVEDFTGDDLPDVIGGASNNGETEGKVFGIDGETGATQWTFTTSGTSVWALERLDDATGDGVPDIIAGDFAGNFYLINPTTGIPFQTGSAGNNLMLRFERMDDVNGNGYADIAIAYSGTNAIMLDGLDGSNIWFTSLADKVWNIYRIEDITGDGINDLVAGTLFSSNYVYFLDGASGDILYSASYGEAVDGIGAIPDINGDGSWEMVAGGRNGYLACFSGGLNAALLQADFVAAPLTGYLPLEVDFTDMSLGDVQEWHWDFENDGTIDSDEQNPTHIYENQGIYSVKLIVGNGTSSDTLVKYDYITVDTIVGIQNHFNDNGISVSPNPSTGDVTIEIRQTGSLPADLTIYNMDGRRVRTISATQKEEGLSTFIWDGKDQEGNNVTSGVYLGHLTVGGKTLAVKLIRK